MPSNLQTVNVIWIIKWKNIFAVDRRRCAQHCNTGTSHSGYNLFWQSRKFFFFPIFCRCFFFFLFVCFVLFVCWRVEGKCGEPGILRVGWLICLFFNLQSSGTQKGQLLLSLRSKKIKKITSHLIPSNQMFSCSIFQQANTSAPIRSVEL